MANRFDQKYEIRLALYEEIPDVMQFIDENWKKGHILATNRDFFEYEMVVDGKVNFLIAKDKESGTIEGILGFLPCSKDQEKLDIWGVVWKTVPQSMPMLGMELKKRLMTIIGARTDLGVGANPRTSVPLLGRIYHYYTAKMKHYYRLADIHEYKIAKVREKNIPHYNPSESVIVKELLNKEELEQFFDFATVKDVIPYKDCWYYTKRFFKHPIYKYSVWGIENIENKKRAVMVTRIQKCNESSAVRIVDYLGEQALFGNCGNFLDLLLRENEYIDFYFDGFEEEYAKSAGMVAVTDDGNIIPDYFYPFEQVNVDIYVDCSNNKERCFFFKGDGDQDRPN
jgi:hypothetical protein